MYAPGPTRCANGTGKAAAELAQLPAPTIDATLNGQALT
jgi:hypothetical protein